MKKYFEQFNWASFMHRGLILIFFIYESFYLLMTNVLTKKEVFSYFHNLYTFLFVSYIISVIVLAIYTSKILSKRFLIQISISYVIYLTISYFIVITRNLNNGKFDLWALDKNHFWETNGTLTVVIIISLSFIFKQLMKYTNYLNKVSLFLEDSNSYHLLQSLLVGSIIIQNSKLLIEIRNNLKTFVDVSDSISYLLPLFKIFIIILILISVLVFVTIDGSEKLRKNQPSLSLVLSTSLLLALIFNYTLQYGVHKNSDLLGKYIFPGATMFQIFVLSTIFVLFFIITNNFVPTALMIIILGTIVSIANMLKNSMRNEPLLITDFVWLREIDLLLGFLDIWMIFYLVLVFLFPVVFYLIFRNRVLVGKIILRKRIRYSLIAILCTILFSIFAVFRDEKDGKISDNIPIISTLNNWVDVTWMGFSTNARYKSVMYVWTKQLSKRIMEVPDDYNEMSIKRLAKKYQKIADQINETRTENISDQTVIYILSESLSNPNRIEGVSLSQNVLSNIDVIKSETTSGLMKSDGYGGGTANMEFQSLTGLPYYNFSNSVSILYTEVVPKMSIFPTISDAFESKNRIVIHPAGANNYNRNNIYRSLGFDKRLFAFDTKSKISNPEYLGASVSDTTTYNNILSNLDTNSSQFFSVITMQNHVPWRIGYPAEIVGKGVGFSETENNSLTEYARLLSFTDQATEISLSKLKKVDKKITVVFYGDHLPGFYPESAFSSNSESRYQTDYFIWSNWQEKKLNYPLVNSSDFTAELLAQTNSKVSPYYALLTKVLDEASIDKKKLSKEGKEIAHDLKLLQYDITLGKGYIRQYDDFFQIRKD